MPNHVLLNNVDHKDLKVITARSAEYGDNIQSAITFSWEFRSIQAHYPIFFRKGAESGEFNAVALFGFEDKENLFLSDAGWDASYIPLTVEREPFLIGFQQPAGSGSSDKAPVIHLDIDSPRISDSEGEAVFLAHGGISAYLERINSILNTINEGYGVHQLFIKELVERDLLESVALDIELNDGSQNRLMGFHTINEDALAGLDGSALADLNEKGFLLPIYMAIASLSNIRALIDKKNALVEQ
ncbi:MAG: SapC family protein [Gammaproteobacteria bacterium]|nr:SapC family protein [Gammaproteobacteria bacterium]